MTTNLFLNNFGASNEQSLVEDIIEESIKFYGIDVSYVPRTLVNRDDIWGEDSLSKFENAYPLEMYIETIDGFGGEQELISRFGLEVRDEINLVLSRRRFKEVTNLEEPREGDLVYLPLSKGLFEIKFVEDEEPFYQLGKNYTYKLICELFEYSQEDLDTGKPEIDDIEKDHENDDSVDNDSFASNDPIETEADTFIDFSESDPFSEGNI